MRILFIDNYDSFTYNVIEMLRQISDAEIVVIKNDELEGVDIQSFDKMIISPGPNLPKASNGLMAFLDRHLESIDTLGICLGHQAIAEYFGGKLLQYNNPKHGERCVVEQTDDNTLFKNVPKEFTVGLYHSWYVSDSNFPSDLIITAKNEDGIIMAMEHKTLPIYSVQFHPESYMSEYGKEILQNFILS